MFGPLLYPSCSERSEFVFEAPSLAKVEFNAKMWGEWGVTCGENGSLFLHLAPPTSFPSFSSLGFLRLRSEEKSPAARRRAAPPSARLPLGDALGDPCSVRCGAGRFEGCGVEGPPGVEGPEGVAVPLRVGAAHGLAAIGESCCTTRHSCSSFAASASCRRRSRCDACTSNEFAASSRVWRRWMRRVSLSSVSFVRGDTASDEAPGGAAGCPTG